MGAAILAFNMVELPVSQQWIKQMKARRYLSKIYQKSNVVCAQIGGDFSYSRSHQGHMKYQQGAS